MARLFTLNMAARFGMFAVLAVLTAAVVLTTRAVVRDGDSSSSGMSVSWVKDYESPEEMLAEPGAIAVVGQVVSKGSSYPVGNGVPVTDSTIRVDQVLFAESLIEPGQHLTVHQTGGTVAGRAVEVEDARLLQPEERVLLFLMYDPVPGSYVIIGGPHGHYSIKSSRIGQANLTGADGMAARHGGKHPLAALTENRTTDEVIALVRAAGVSIQSR